MIIRPFGRSGDLAREVAPGDILAGGEVGSGTTGPGALTTVGAGTWLGSMIAAGHIVRTGPAAGYTDTTDTAQNILAALAGANPNAGIAPGNTMRLRFYNRVAFLMTLAAGRGVVLGTNMSNVVNCAASLIREYLLTILNNTPEVALNCNTTNGSAVVTFVLPPNMSALPMGQADNPQGITITPGMAVTGTGIAANTTVIGVTQGPGGVTGVTLSQNATATSGSGGVQLTFSPVIQIDGLGTLGL